MARSGFRRSSHRRPFRASRFAKKELLWVTTQQNITEVAGATPSVLLLATSQWQSNATSGNWSSAKVLKVILDVTATALATAESRLFALLIDDISQSSLNPLVPANYAQMNPFHLGRFAIGGNTQVQGALGQSNNFLDNMREYKVNRKIKADQSLNMYISPAAAAANQLTYSIFARVLVELN